ncbi:MFS transporter [Sphingobacterium endophyticum]|uniref:MFS transporter n=1 Tax=Sphingobacterium endophyticum TaxID=2546448 RepID=UPI001E336B0D|nr:MFS transporter [Sphingobacterium endophyticum]
MKISNSQLAFIAIIASLGGFIFGFDMAVVSGVLPLVKMQFHLDTFMEGWFVSSALLGCIIGVLISGSLSDQYGRKRTMQTAAAIFVLATFACIFLESFSLIIWTRILTGIGIGIASNVVPLYLSEIAPIKDRGKLVTFYQLALTFGIVLAYTSNALIIKYQDELGQIVSHSLFQYVFVEEEWRAMIGMSVIPSLAFFIGLLIVPESPSWSKDQSKSDQSGYSELLKPIYRKAMVIGLFLPIFSQFCGINVIIYYGPTILKTLGFSLDNSLYGQIIIGVANMLFTLIAIWKVDSWGRRPLYLVGTIGGAASLFLTSLLFYFGMAESWLLVISVVCFLAFFAFSIGPLKFVVASEIFPSNIRAKAMGVSILAMWVSDFLMGQITPFLLDDVGVSGTFLFLGLVCLLGFVFVIRKLPETKGKSPDVIHELLNMDKR